MASPAAALRGKRSTARRPSRPTRPSAISTLARRLLALPRWVLWLTGTVLLVALIAGGGIAFYRSLDTLYPQPLWRYYRSQASPAGGSVLYRDLDGQLLLAPLGDLDHPRRLDDTEAIAAGKELVRDAIALPATTAGKQLIAYLATEKRDGRPDSDHVKVIDTTGQLQQNVTVPATAPLRPTLHRSASGRYLALTTRDGSRIYLLDRAAVGVGGTGSAEATWTTTTAEALPEPIQWTHNGDVHTAPLNGQPTYALSTDGKHRAQLRNGARRAPECDDPKCEAAQELVVTSMVPAESSGGPTVLFGAFANFAADGWGPVPTQPPLRLFGRLIWSPDGTHLLFNALDGSQPSMFAIGTDGRTQPHRLLEGAEALDWLA